VRLLRGAGLLLALTAGVAALCSLAAALFTYFHGGTTYAHAIAYTMWGVGGLVVLLVGGSGSTTQMSGPSHVVVGGRFVEGHDLPAPTSPFVLIPAGLLVVALGVLVYLA
jgi:hypothetical protein